MLHKSTAAFIGGGAARYSRSRLTKLLFSSSLILRHPHHPLKMMSGGGGGSSASSPLSTHAKTAQSASEFLSDPSLLRDQAYVNGKWVDAVGNQATYAVEGT